MKKRRVKLWYRDENGLHVLNEIRICGRSYGFYREDGKTILERVLNYN